jgi:hypothetical protein
MPVGEREALEACRALFGVPADGAFLRDLALASVKRAFRQKALLLHPDRFSAAAPALQRRQTERFQAISGAYEALLAWLDQAGRSGVRAVGTPARPPAPPSSPRPPAPPPPPPPVNTWRGSPGPAPAASPVPPPTNRWQGPFTVPGAPPAGREGLGAYLHRRGLISHRTLLAALIWQRRGRPRIGELAVRWGWLTPAQVQAVLVARPLGGRFADRAVDLGLLTPFRARTLLRFQGSRQRRLGDYFVDHGVLAREQVERLAELHRADVARAGETAARHEPVAATVAAGRRAASRA